VRSDGALGLLSGMHTNFVARSGTASVALQVMGPYCLRRLFMDQQICISDCSNDGKVGILFKIPTTIQ
jgi:hypothetical protein